METLFLFQFCFLTAAGLYQILQEGRLARTSGVFLLGQATIFLWILAGRIKSGMTPILGPGAQIYADPLAQSALQVLLLFFAAAVIYVFYKEAR